MKMEISNMNDVLAAMNALAEIEEMFPEVEQETTDEDQDDSIPMYTREVDRLRYSIRRKSDFKAKERLAKLYPISTDSIRKTRNGAPIHKGNTYKWDWKRYDRKLSREEGKRLCREWEPDDFQEMESLYADNLAFRIANLKNDRKWIVNALNLVTEEILRKGWSENLGEYMDEINTELEEVNKALAALRTVQLTGKYSL